MGAVHPLPVTSPAELQMQIETPSPDVIRARAAEVFGNGRKAKAWLARPRRIFQDRSPNQILESNDIPMMREVLKALIAIEYGTFS